MRLLLPALLLTLAGCDMPEEPTNVLFIVVDSLRADHTSLHGYERRTTPAIDEWAEDGVVFERVWSPSSELHTAMSMLMTGRPDGRLTLAEVFAGNGYATWAAVAHPDLAPAAEFERYGAHPELLAEALVDVARARLDARDGRPFFGYLHFFDPHRPYRPEDGLAFEPFEDRGRQRRFRAALPEKEQYRLDDETYAEIETRIALYDSEIRQVDDALGELFRYLEDSGLADTTLVVLTSAHGEGLWQRAPRPGVPLELNGFFPHLVQEAGDTLYSEELHVPLVFRGPGIPPGVRNTEDRTLLDVMPTIAARLGLPPLEGLVGGDLMQLAGTGPWPQIHATCARERSVTVDGRWRLHVPVEGDPELYDLREDPLELMPIPDEERIESLRALAR